MGRILVAEQTLALKIVRHSCSSQNFIQRRTHFTDLNGFMDMLCIFIQMVLVYKWTHVVFSTRLIAG